MGTDTEKARAYGRFYRKEPPDAAPKNVGFWRVSTLKHYRSLPRPPKGTYSRETASYELSRLKIKKKGKERYKSHKLVIFHVIEEKPPCERILTKFRTSRDMADVIICVKFGVEKLRG